MGGGLNARAAPFSGVAAYLVPVLITHWAKTLARQGVRRGLAGLLLPGGGLVTDGGRWPVGKEQLVSTCKGLAGVVRLELQPSMEY